VKALKKEDLFINKILEETFLFIPENETTQNSNDLLTYFNKQSIKGDISNTKQFFEGQLKKSKVNFIPFNFLSDINCFRISIAGSIVDFPNNWSIFEELHEGYKKGENASIFVSIENDIENLLEIFRPFSSYDCNLVFLNFKGSLYLVFLPENDQKLFNWIEFFVSSLI
jgi:hypothetical protein